VWLIKVITIVALLAIFGQDIRSRSVYWWLFPALLIGLLNIRLLEHEPFTIIIRSTGMNLVFLVLQLLIVSAYFSLKHRSWVNITRQLLGWGDILFLAAITVYLSFLNYLLFYLVSLTMSLLIGLSFQAGNGKPGQIPLAGLQALALALLLGVAWWYRPDDLTSDEGLLYFLTR
jgi:hypothetical protein